MTTRLGAWWVVAGAALFGTVGTVRLLGPETPALPLAAARLLLAAGLFIAVARWWGAPRNRRLPAGHRELHGGRWSAAARVPAVWTAAVGQAAFQWCFLAAVPRTGVAVGTLVAIGATPVLTGALSRRVDRRWAAATGLGLVGLVLLVGFGSRPEPAGLLLALGAAASYAVYLVSGAGIAAAGHRYGLDLDTMLAAVFTVAALLLLVPAVGSGPWQWLVTPGGAAMTVYLAVVPTVVAYRLLAAGLRVVAPGPAATLALTEPVVAASLGIVVLGERLSVPATLGAVLVLTAVLVLARAPARTLQPAAQG